MERPRASVPSGTSSASSNVIAILPFSAKGGCRRKWRCERRGRRRRAGSWCPFKSFETFDPRYDRRRDAKSPRLLGCSGRVMRSEEIRATGQLATRTLADTVSHVEQVHRALAGRTFALTAPASLPVRLIHDVIATGVYKFIRGAGLASGLVASHVVSAAAGSVLPAGSTARSNLALAVLNATLGDELANQGSPLAIPMAVRRVRADVVLRPRPSKSHSPRRRRR